MKKNNEGLGCALKIDELVFKQTDADKIFELLNELAMLSEITQNNAFDKLRCVMDIEEHVINDRTDSPQEKMTPMFSDMRHLINKVYGDLEIISGYIYNAELPIWKR